eukprot:15482283-Alexandrium_andersonii.AAC.1
MTQRHPLDVWQGTRAQNAGQRCMRIRWHVTSSVHKHVDWLCLPCACVHARRGTRITWTHPQACMHAWTRACERMSECASVTRARRLTTTTKHTRMAWCGMRVCMCDTATVGVCACAHVMCLCAACARMSTSVCVHVCACAGVYASRACGRMWLGVSVCITVRAQAQCWQVGERACAGVRVCVRVCAHCVRMHACA